MLMPIRHFHAAIFAIFLAIAAAAAAAFHAAIAAIRFLSAPQRWFHDVIALS
jgi:hypothetical protein